MIATRRTLAELRDQLMYDLRVCVTHPHRLNSDKALGFRFHEQAILCAHCCFAFRTEPKQQSVIRPGMAAKRVQCRW